MELFSKLMISLLHLTALLSYIDHFSQLGCILLPRLAFIGLTRDVEPVFERSHLTLHICNDLTRFLETVALL